MIDKTVDRLEVFKFNLYNISRSRFGENDDRQFGVHVNK